MMTARELTRKVSNEGTCAFKYVRFGEKNVVFGDTDRDTHDRLLPEGALPVSAGVGLIFRGGSLRILKISSLSLGIGPSESDGPVIREILGI